MPYDRWDKNKQRRAETKELGNPLFSIIPFPPLLDNHFPPSRTSFFTPPSLSHPSSTERSHSWLRPTLMTCRRLPKIQSNITPDLSVVGVHFVLPGRCQDWSQNIFHINHYPQVSLYCWQFSQMDCWLAGWLVVDGRDLIGHLVHCVVITTIILIILGLLLLLHWDRYS